jgi:hypothetical protein
MQGVCPEVPAPEIWAISGQTGKMAKGKKADGVTILPETIPDFGLIC